jgi:shikimate kinase
MNIVLIGYRGSGKSSIGKRLASNLWMDFVDTDALIVERAEKTIREIFEAEGEEGFRRRETAVIREVTGRDNHVIAVGGGAVLAPENVQAMKANGKVVWLRAPAETLHKRIQADAETNASRPNLTAAGGVDEVKQLLEVRTPLYEAAADLTLDVTFLEIDAAAARLVTLL